MWLNQGKAPEAPRRSIAATKSILVSGNKTCHFSPSLGSMASIGRIAAAMLLLGAAVELVDTVRWTLLHFMALFRGVRDLERDISEDNWLCYVGNPGHAYDHKTGAKRPPWPGEVFLVFVTDERVIYNWYWCVR
jgi:hypothetical protein